MENYLASSEHIDWQHAVVFAKAVELAAGAELDETIAKRCFEFVRDSIKHSWDYRQNPPTCKASDVLLHGTGFCYQRLSVEVDSPMHCRR